MEDSSEDQSNSTSDSSISSGSSYYYYSDVGDTYEYDEDSKIEKEIIQDQKTISGQKTYKKYESTLNTVDTREADISSAKQLGTQKKNKIQETRTEPERKYKCQKCARNYKHKCTLNSHQKYECDVTPQFICVFCDKRFKQKSGMNSHIFRVHQVTISNQKIEKIQESKHKHTGYRHEKANLNTSQAKLFCDKCSQAYRTLSGLRRHNLVKHAAVKPQFTCYFCGYKANVKFNLSLHITSRHFKELKTSQARHNCDECSLNYCSLGALQKHKRLKHAAVKPQFICDDCGFKTSIKSHLSRHISSRHLKNSKTSQPSYNCDKCSLNYCSLGSLQQHKRLKHAAVKPEFICDFCGYKPYMKSHLRRHISSCHLKNLKTLEGRQNSDKCS